VRSSSRRSAARCEQKRRRTRGVPEAGQSPPRDDGLANRHEQVRLKVNGTRGLVQPTIGSSSRHRGTQVKAVERGVDQLYDYVAELAAFGLELAEVRARHQETRWRRRVSARQATAPQGGSADSAIPRGGRARRAACGRRRARLLSAVRSAHRPAADDRRDGQVRACEWGRPVRCGGGRSTRHISGS
jgi:hypothetical protein